MNSRILIDKFRKAFGDIVALPIAVSYTDTPLREPEEKVHCMMRWLIKAKDGIATSLSADNIYCRGGKVYSGYAPLTEGICKFVSDIEKYKDKPENVARFVENLQIIPAEKPYITLQRIDELDSLDDVEGIVIFATPDVLSGLWSWANFDLNVDDAVVANFASGCSFSIANLIRENNINGYRCFIGMLDVSVRPLLNPNELAFAIPRCRLEKMIHTFDNCCLSGAPAWQKVYNRINE